MYPNIKQELERFDFQWMLGNLYVLDSDNLAKVYKAINALERIDWFKNFINDIRVFKISDISDFTGLIKVRINK
jgi:virulence-associated protein VapD